MFSSKCPLCDCELSYYLEHIHPDCYRGGPVLGGPFLACDNCAPGGLGFEPYGFNPDDFSYYDFNPDDFNYVIMLNKSGEIISEKISTDLYLIENNFRRKQCYVFFARSSSKVYLDDIYLGAKDIDKIKNYAMLA